MRKQIILSGILLIATFFYSCKKKEPSPEIEQSISFIAPCSPEINTWMDAVDTLYYGEDSIFSTPNIQLVTCNYMIQSNVTNQDVTTYVYFKEEPQTGYYITTSGGFFEYPNSVVLRSDYVSYQFRTMDWDTIYVWNHDSIIDISFCGLRMYTEGLPNSTGEINKAHIRVHK